MMNSYLYGKLILCNEIWFTIMTFIFKINPWKIFKFLSRTISQNPAVAFVTVLVAYKSLDSWLLQMWQKTRKNIYSFFLLPEKKIFIALACLRWYLQLLGKYLVCIYLNIKWAECWAPLEMFACSLGVHLSGEDRCSVIRGELPLDTDRRLGDQAFHL